ncbi:MAG: hypothetical protein KGN77_08885 [Xanthomonadaceae bacterium]|nr:hypothetical protein [Xanthomonadaceae bacterium]MDE1964114.1 hypothetical protein [Xanthomonadaceae bacterium]
MASPFDEFLHEHRRIEAWLSDRTRGQRHRPFLEMAREVAPSHPLLKRHLQRLVELTELRNLLAHKPGSRREPIAMPTASVVQELRDLADRLTAPPPLPPSVLHEVECFDIAQPVGAALKAMRRRNYSQVPITEQGRVDWLLTANTVMRWLARQVDDELVDVAGTPISEVLQATEKSERWGFCRTQADSADVLGRFVNAQEEGKPLVALLLTDSGTERGTLRGIVTTSDLGKLASCLVSGRR